MSPTIITLRCSAFALDPRANSCVFPSEWNSIHIKLNRARTGRQKVKDGSCLERSLKRDFVVFAQPGPAAPPPPPGPLPSSWKTWIIGAVLTFIVPFMRHKWGPFFNLTKKMESVVKKAEKATEGIEKLAEEVEKVAEAVADELPEGGKLRGFAEFVEEAIKEVEKDAHLAEDILEKIEEIDREVEEFIEPAVNDQATKTPKEANAQE